MFIMFKYLKVIKVKEMRILRKESAVFFLKVVNFKRVILKNAEI